MKTDAQTTNHDTTAHIDMLSFYLQESAGASLEINTATTPKAPAPRIDFEFSKRVSSTSAADRIFPIILIMMITFGISIGITAHNVPPLQQSITRTIRKITTEFHFSEPPKSVPVSPPVVKKEVVVKKDTEPVDLTKKTPVVTTAEETIEPPAPQPQVVRKVFGLRRVYASGLGSGGSMSDGIVAKIGNTISKEYDTVTATESDIKGTVVSVVSITSAPRFRRVVKPTYTKEMIEQKVEGTIKVKVLVDIDGKVKKATCLNDIGFGSAAEAMKATLQMEFEPGMRDAEPVAVWIIVPITFALLG